MRIIVRRRNNGFILASAFFDKRQMVNLVISEEDAEIMFTIDIPRERIALDVVITNEEEA